MSRHRSTSAWLAAVLLLATPRAHAQAGDIGSPPGRLVDIGGRRLHLHCTGQGSPTVVFENGGGAFSIDWALVQPAIAKSTRACSYDRARHAWSDPGPDAETPAAVARDLHALLTAAREKPPYVVAGHAELQESRRTRPNEFANRHAVVPGAGHEIQLCQPAVVVQAIEEVATNVRSK